MILTRASKVRGTPTLWSRFVQRVAAVAGEVAWNDALARGARYVALAHELAEEPLEAQLQMRSPLLERRRGGRECEQERGEEAHSVSLHGD